MSGRRVLTFYGPYTEDKYNQFFNPNVCHVCKQRKKDLITCNRCYMISYCSEEHKAIHRNSHSKICTIIARVITETSFWNMYASLEEWIESRKRILHQVISNLYPRYIQQYEIEMIMCAKSCCVCFRQASVKLCNTCYSANFCDDHQLLVNILIHKKCCDDLLLLLEMNINHINGYMEHILHKDRYKFSEFPEARSYDDTVTFISNYVRINYHLSVDTIKLKTSVPNIYWSIDQYIYSDYTSGPLTLYYALQESNLISLSTNRLKYIIHVIDVNKTVNILCLKMWHIFLHLFSRTKELYIVFINSLKFESSDLGSVCSMCARYKQQIFVRSVSGPYHDFVHLDSFEKPNVIILFEIECLFIGTWFDSIEAIVAQECPLLLTADSENTVQENVNKIEIKTGINRNRLYRENKFRGYMPHRNYTTGGLYYRNAHFIMYS
ncbi:uncharacterized protein LOC116847521 [Odontomachus brunneus]|uniref:uncharacterized protein LOC116847521 n=1 Tax=Odontomachus brunneus TaxID=486640 RepID=UPI0013F2228B|nr:uncharacterized protein LOC116847521 [Odontomachus brunneus]